MAISPLGREPGMTTIDVQLRAEWIKRVGYRYDVLLDGEIIVHRSRDPEHDVARVLHARGFRGRFRTIDYRTGRPRMELDIAKAAGLSSIERDDRGLMTIPYRPMSEEDKARTRRHRACQGRLFREEMALDTPDPEKAAGGETCADPRRVPEDA